ncbi:cilia- and flagella-associated protein 44-like isoform X5 [Bolinopsis microptera]|uniref:cilia- and flagella-associated protein 44-like isoform X5 n=1 Tax=Bolinopsis microptera TaxID=2820187 RepID=UPI003079046D
MSEDQKPSAFGKLNLKDATNKVNAEALRQFTIEAEDDQALEQSVGGSESPSGKRKKKEAAAAAALAAVSGEAAGPEQGETEEGKASTEDVKVNLVPTPPQTPKDGSRPSSSRKAITPVAAAVGGEEGSTGGSKPAEAADQDKSKETTGKTPEEKATAEKKDSDKLKDSDKTVSKTSMTAEKLSEEKPGEEKPGEGQSGGENPSDNTASAVPTSGDKPNQTSGDKGGDAAGDVDAKSGEAGKVGGGKASSGDAEGGELEASSGDAGVTGEGGEAGKEGGKEDNAPVADTVVTKEGADKSEYETDSNASVDEATDAPKKLRKKKKKTEGATGEAAAKGELGTGGAVGAAGAAEGEGEVEAVVTAENGKKSAIDEKYPEMLDYNPDDDVDPGPDPNFFYDLEQMYARAKTSSGEGSTPSNFLTLFHSFGYECLKRANLHVLDETHVLFSAGNYIQIFNVDTKKLTYLPTVGGKGIGSIAVHPSRKYFAVGEQGFEPEILIFEYPSLKLYRICRKGTERSYAFLSFSPDGAKLASLGSSPDYMLTIWDWKREKIILRSKAHGQDVFRVTFSTEIEGQLTTGGLGHIKFWKMAATFTGLKLQGELGKYGRTAISDIEGYVELPDGKVLSGSEWGNMLLWDGDLIKCELSSTENKNCHKGQIQEIFLDEGELITAGADGSVKIWDFETIDGADVLEEDAMFPMEPMSEMHVGDGVSIISMCKTVTENNDTNSMWLAQDASGGIWRLDISVSLTKKAPELIQSYHAGPVRGIAPCSYTHMAASMGADGTVRVFDYLRKHTLVRKKYKSGGSCILWPGRNVDSKCVTLIGGFSDGVIRVMTLDYAEQESEYELKISLQHALKPHKGEVTAMIIDDEGKTLVTGSKDDCTLFFFDITSNYLPIGFMKLEAPVTTMAWSNSSMIFGRKDPRPIKRVLVGLSSGVVLEVECPDSGEVDSSVTYEIQPGSKINRYEFKSIGYKIKKAAHEMVKIKKEEEQQKRLDKIMVDEGEEAYLEEKKAIEDTNSAEEDPVFEPPTVSNQIIKIFPYEDRFYLSLDGTDTGALYECTFNDPLADMPTPPSMRGRWVRLNGEPLRVIDMDTDIEIHEINLMQDGSNVMVGMGDGTIRIHKKLEGSGLQMGPPFTLPAHSSGSVNGIMTSFDTRFLISGGNDGNLFVYKVNHAGVELSLPSPSDSLLKSKVKEEITGPPVDDIDDLKAYSIEEAKQKREHEKMLKTAEDKKIKVRKTIATLRSKFKKLKVVNKDLPKHLTLLANDFSMDPQMGSIIAQEVSDSKDLIRKQLAWNSEKHRIELMKLRKRFKDVVATDRIVLHAVESDHLVSTFRCAKPSEAMQQALDDFHKKLAADSNGAPGSRGSDARRISTMARQGLGFVRKNTELDMHGPSAVVGSKGGKKLKDAKANKSLQKAEERKSKRLQRELAWKNLSSRKPSENYEDPQMLAAIEDAKNNMGDFNLKTAKNYKVPESQRQGGTFKRAQLLELRRMIYMTKMNFNERLLALRDRKQKMITEAEDWSGRLDTIQAKLPAGSIMAKPKVPVLLDDELPERAMEYTPESLREFKIRHDEEKKRGPADEGGFGGFGGFGDSPPAPTAAETKAAAPVAKQAAAPAAAAGDKGGEGGTEAEEAELEDLVSTLENENENLEIMMMLHEQECLISQMNEAYKEFDKEVVKLRTAKIELDVELKNGDLRIILLFEELLLLKEFEKRENILQEALSSKLSDRDEMSDKIEELEEKLSSKKLYMEELQENEKILYDSFTEQLGENNKFADYLTKVFKKKIKRVKKAAEMDGDSDESDSDDDFDSSSEEEDDDEDGVEHLDLNICPPGCSQELYDATIVMREKKLDLEEAIQEEKKIIDSLRKEVDALVKKNKVISHGVKCAKNDLEAFQLEKQKKMNELDIVVTLNLDQIQYMQNGVLPSDLVSCLVFHSAGVNQLASRIKELQQEKAHQIRKFKELKKSHIHLIKGKKGMQEKLLGLDEKCQNMMLLKFGREVDLKKLENISTNRIAEELKETIAKKDVKYSRKLNEWDVQINQAKQRLLTATRDHTSHLDILNELTKDKQDLESVLDSKQKNLGGEYSGQRKADLKERQRLLQLVQLQAQEIDALKDEIGILSRKDGHILPPTQTAVPPLPPIGGRC